MAFEENIINIEGPAKGRPMSSKIYGLIWVREKLGRRLQIWELLGYIINDTGRQG